MSELAIGIVGLGRMGTYHLETWEHVEGAQVVAVAEPDADLAHERIGRRPIAHFEYHRDLVARSDVDAICITAPSAQHAEHRARRASPPASTYSSRSRSPPRWRTACAWPPPPARAGRQAHGRPRRALQPGGRQAQGADRATAASAASSAPTPRASARCPLRIQDAGVAIDLATHDLDIMQFVLGRDISRVYAEGAQLSHPTQEDMITCLLRFGDDGPFGLLDVNWLTPEKRREISVIGEDGMLTASYLTQDVWFTESPTKRRAGTSWRASAATPRARPCASPCASVEPLRAELEAFAACVRDDTAEPVTAYDGCRALIAALAVRDSAANSRPVTLLDMPSPAPLAVAA